MYFYFHRMIANNYKSWKSLFLIRNLKGFGQCFKVVQYGFMRYLITRYLHLHKIDKIFVNLQTREVEMLIDNKFIFPVEFSFLKLDMEAFFSKNNRLHLEEEIFKKILDIFKKRHAFEYTGHKE